MNREASAEWKGGLKDGRGTVSTRSGTLRDVPYTFKDRFEDGNGTNPEELIAAAHSGCFSMALSGQLGEAKMVADSIKTRATLTMEKKDAGMTVTSIHLDVVARIPGADRVAFEKAVEAARKTCPISRLLNAEITASARLEG